MRSSNNVRSKFVIDMSVPNSILSLDGPTVTKTRPSGLEVIGSSIVNPFSDLTTQFNDLMTSSDNDRGLAEQSREAREEFIRTISRLKEESQSSLAYLEQIQSNPEHSTPLTESLIAPASPEMEETTSVGNEDLNYLHLSPVPEDPITSNETYQLSSPIAPHQAYKLVLDSDAESIDSFTLKNTSPARKFGGSQETLGSPLGVQFMREMSCSDPQLFSLNSAHLSYQDTALIATPPLRDRSTSDPCLGSLKSLLSETGVVSLPNLQINTNINSSKEFHVDNPHAGEVIAEEFSENIIQVQEADPVANLLESDAVRIQEFGSIHKDDALNIEYVLDQTSKGQIKIKQLKQVPGIDDLLTNIPFAENGESNQENDTSIQDLTTQPLIPNLEQKDVFQLEPPSSTVHGPQTSKAFIPRSHKVVDNMWNEFSLSKYSFPTPKAKKTLRNTIPHPFSVYYKSLEPRKKTKAQIQGETQRRLELESVERECSTKFVSKPVPKSTFEPRFQKMLEKDESRRQQNRNVSKNILESAMKPFKFDRGPTDKSLTQDSHSTASFSSQNQLFKAKPVPKHLFQTRYQDEVAEQDLYREIRKVMRTNQLLSTSKLPPSMSASEKTLSYTDGFRRRARDEQKSKQAFLTTEHRFKPTVNKRMPDFKRQQELFEQKMLERRQEQRIARLEFSEQEITVAELEIGGGNTLEITIPSFSSDVLKISTTDKAPVKKRQVSRLDGVYGHAPTKSTQLRQSLTSQRIIEQVSRERDERERACEQMERTKRMRKQVVERVREFDTREEMERRAEEKKRQFIEMEQSRQNDYTEHLRMIREKLQERPLVFERVVLNQKEHATNKFHSLLRKSGVAIDELNNTYNLSPQKILSSS